MPPEENRRILLQYVAEVLQARDPQAAERFVAPDVEYHGLYVEDAAPQGLDRYVADFLCRYDPAAARRYAGRKARPGASPPLPTREGLDGRVRSILAAFPDLRFSAEDTVAEGDQVVLRFTMRGTHTGAPFLGSPPTGRPFEVQGLILYRFAAGRIVEVRPAYDQLSVLQQLGLGAPVGLAAPG